MRLFAIVLVFLLLFGCPRPPESPPAKNQQEAQKEEQQYKKEIDEIRKTLKSDLKVKLKRDGKAESYSWEISGKDTGEVLRANDVLVKKLGDAGTAK
ncbi:MAG: hypothetical protein ABSC19_11760 [Syntrophorhabdales bacterium]|jgi:outer membrane biogenesis lipoprotein LolB